jgi:hypothetical protein
MTPMNDRDQLERRRDEPDVTHAKGHHVDFLPSDGWCGVVGRLRVARVRSTADSLTHRAVALALIRLT